VGYLVFIATAVFLFGDLDAVYGGYTLAALDTEQYVTFGIVVLGVAFVLSRWSSELPALYRRHPARATAGQPASVAAP
jgi:hypothetical protein